MCPSQVESLEAIASWVEAEIGMRQVALVKRRLKEMVEDYGSRAKALEAPSGGFWAR